MCIAGKICLIRLWVTTIAIFALSTRFHKCHLNVLRNDKCASIFGTKLRMKGFTYPWIVLVPSGSFPALMLLVLHTYMGPLFAASDWLAYGRGSRESFSQIGKDSFRMPLRDLKPISLHSFIAFMLHSAFFLSSWFVLPGWHAKKMWKGASICS